MKTPKIILKFLVVAGLTMMTAACGWQLRGFNQGTLPPELALHTKDPYAPLARQLQQTLIRRGVTLTTTAPVRLWLDEETKEKRAVAVTSIGSAAQYELTLEVSFQFANNGELLDAKQEPTLPQTLIAQRTYDFIPGSNLSKVEEEQTLLREMRQELINRILAQAPKIEPDEPKTKDSQQNELIIPPEEVLDHRAPASENNMTSTGSTHGQD